MASISNDYFTIQCREEYKPYLDTILEMVSKKGEEVRRFFTCSGYRPVKVTLFDDLEDLKDEATKTKKRFEDYAEGSFSNKGIGVYVKDTLNNNNLIYVVNRIVHQYSHIIYASVCKEEDGHALWLDEGIAQTLSGERSSLQNSNEKSKSAFLSRIVCRRKEIPKLEYLNTEGNGKYSIESPRYSGYLLCYFMVNYLLSSKVPGNIPIKDDYLLLDKSINICEKPAAIKKYEEKNVPLRNRYNFNLLLTDPEYRKKVEETLVVRTINYFGSNLGVKMSSASYRHVKTPQDILDYMYTNFAYGWYDEKNELHKNPFDFEKRYRVSSFKEILKTSYGTKLEYAKFILVTLKRLGFQASILFNESIDELDHVKLEPAVVYLGRNNQFYLVCVPSSKYEGIHKFSSFKDLLKGYISSMEEGDILYESLDIPDGLTYQELVDYVSTSDKIYEVPKNNNNDLSKC